jgi:threonine/homoserine/homoserine lactone efflux protein
MKFPCSHSLSRPRSSLTPGPDMGYLAVLAASAGRRAGFAATAGVAAGLLSAGIASSLGLAGIVATSTLIYEMLRWGGLFYLLWLAWEGWCDAGGIDKPIDAGSHAGFFLRDFITNLLNPKAGIFFLSVFPSFIDEGRPLLAQTEILLAVYVTIATVIHSAVVLSADAIRPLSPSAFCNQAWEMEHKKDKSDGQPSTRGLTRIIRSEHRSFCT